MNIYRSIKVWYRTAGSPANCQQEEQTAERRRRERGSANSSVATVLYDRCDSSWNTAERQMSPTLACMSFKYCNHNYCDI